ncbi:CSEP0446 putative effector protein [Blumeria hordei DH14]|uniref:CSEP0446 putative effector protein n=1 Tax=Blumeria graminis f. sp. hordei (strain DH14) TaxID=546991 RepID=N1JIZ8_BLUG1|nr:CSEP0446 putative effector protein [Blumeria hordei DH14]
MLYPFFLLISIAGTFNNKDLYNYNIVYPAGQEASIQYFSNQTPEKFWTRIGTKFLGYFDYTKSRNVHFPYPSGYYVTENGQHFRNSHDALTRELANAGERVGIKSITNKKQADCVKELRHVSQHETVSISSIMNKRFQHCQINLMIDLIHSGQVRIRKSERDCTYEPQVPCIVGDISVPVHSIADDFRILASAKRHGRNAYLVTVAGNLKVILHQSKKQHIIVPKLGDQQSDDIYRFLLMISKNRVPSASVVLQTDVVDLYTSATGDGANLYHNFISKEN